MNVRATELELRGVSAGYAGSPVLHNISVQITGGEFLAVLGPSGCGKTTLLRVIAGLLRPFAGEVLFDSAPFTDVPTEVRGAAAVFQKPLLFPHLTVAENVAFGLTMRRVGKPEIAHRVAEALQLVELEGYQSRKPHELSGGEEQRVSLARAVVTRPRVLLLDEPFSSLDTGLRIKMRAFVLNLQKQLNVTTIFVTHDQEEAATLANRIALLLDGRVEQLASPHGMYTSPNTARAAAFLGWKVLEGQRNGNGIETPIGSFAVLRQQHDLLSGGRCQIAFHPSNARLARLHPDASPVLNSSIIGTLDAVVDLGTRIRLIVRLQSGELLEVDDNFERSAFGELRVGERVSIQISPESLRVF